MRVRFFTRYAYPFMLICRQSVRRHQLANVLVLQDLPRRQALPQIGRVLAMVSFSFPESVGSRSLTNALMHRFLDTVHLVLCVYMVYYYVVTEFGNEFALLTVHWSLKAGHPRLPHRGTPLTSKHRHN